MDDLQKRFLDAEKELDQKAKILKKSGQFGREELNNNLLSLIDDDDEVLFFI